MTNAQPPGAESRHSAPQVGGDPLPGVRVGAQQGIRPGHAGALQAPNTVGADQRVPRAIPLQRQPYPGRAIELQGARIEAVDQDLEHVGAHGRDPVGGLRQMPVIGAAAIERPRCGSRQVSSIVLSRL